MNELPKTIYVDPNPNYGGKWYTKKSENLVTYNQQVEELDFNFLMAWAEENRLEVMSSNIDVRLTTVFDLNNLDKVYTEAPSALEALRKAYTMWKEAHEPVEQTLED